jgi:uncharacterized membrane protein (UPF0136 family)
MTIYVLCAYAALLALGGLIGYVKSGSMISIFSGSLSALSLMASVYMIRKRKPVGYLCAIAMTMMLSVLFAYRFSLAFSWMPAGMMLVVSLLVLLFLLGRGKK